MEIFRKLKSENTEMALRIARAAIREASPIILVELMALIADELKRRTVAALKQRIRRNWSKSE